MAKRAARDFLASEMIGKNSSSAFSFQTVGALSARCTKFFPEYD